MKLSSSCNFKERFSEYVVPPLEGLWWQEGIEEGFEVCDYSHKENFCWISVIRLPDFVKKKDFDWAVKTAAAKKRIDCSKAEFLTLNEGLCVQIMHHGSFDAEPATIAIMKKYIEENGYAFDLSEKRLHHEIYLTDPRKSSQDKNRCVIRYPIKKNQEEMEN